MVDVSSLGNDVDERVAVLKVSTKIIGVVSTHLIGVTDINQVTIETRQARDEHLIGKSVLNMA